MALKDCQILNLYDDTPVNRSFYCNNGDKNTRGLEVHVLDNAQPRDCTGLTLELIIRVPSGEYFTAPATPLVITDGVFQVLFPNNMGKGRFIAELILSSGPAEILVSRKFSILGDGSLTSDGSIQATPSGGLLWTVLQNEAQRQADFDAILGSLDAEVSAKYSGLEVEYAEDLTEVKTSLAQKVSYVNGVAPDEDGNVYVQAGGGSGYAGIEVRSTNPSGGDLYEGRIWILNIPVPTAPLISLVGTGVTTATIQLDTASLDGEGAAITIYDIYKDGVLYESDVSLTAGGTYQLIGLVTLTTYAITLKGKNIAGSSIASNSISATTVSDGSIHFNTASDLTDNFGVAKTGNTTITVDEANGLLKIANSVSTSDAGFVYDLDPLVKTESKTITHTGRPITTAEANALELVIGASAPTILTSTGANANWLAVMQIILSANKGVIIIKRANGTVEWWNGSAWTTTPFAGVTLGGSSVDYRVIAETDGVNQKVRFIMKSASGLTTYQTTDWILWSDLVPAGQINENIYLGWGDRVNNAGVTNYNTTEYSRV